MIKILLIATLIVTSVYSFAQDVERTLPAKWDSLVYGGQFSDLFQAMPIIGGLTSDTWGAEDTRPRDLSNGIEDPAWSYWGGRPFQTKDGKYNMFICRWPENHPKGHWAYHYSEIVRTISDNPVGPYKATDQIVGFGHNPDLYQLKDGRYVIYSVSVGHRICYFISESLDGTWKEGGLYQFDLRGRKKLRFMVNMSFIKREDGSYIAMPRAGDMWISKDGISTYERVSNGSTHPPMPGKYEDPVIWKDHIQYHKIVNDWYGRIAHYQRSLDGIHWVEEPGQAYFPGISKYEDGTQTNWYKYERIRMLQDEYGRAVQANFAVIDSSKHADFPNDNHNSKNISIPLTKSRLVEVLNTKRITAATSEIRVKIKAEKDFNPRKDMNLTSLRLGASETVNYGGGCKVKSSKKEGNDIILTFEGEHGLSDENFAIKLLGKTKKGDLLMGWARLPGIDYLPPILSSRKPYIPENNKPYIEVEVQNYGLSASVAQSLVFQFENEKEVVKLKGKLPALKPYEKVLVQFENTAGLTKDSKGIISVYPAGEVKELLFAQPQKLDLIKSQNEIFEEPGKPLEEQAFLKKGELNSRVTKGKYAVGYHAYIPESFNPQKAPPIVIAFSPGGNGAAIAKKINEGVKELGWIVVGCDSLRNNMKDEKLEVEMEDVLLNDILKTIPHNNKRIYLAGFSGGAMRAYGITARRKEHFAGVIAYGGWLGGKDYQDAPYPGGLSVAMINGNVDRGANAWVSTDTKTLLGRGCNVKHFSCEGGHKIAPSNITHQAVQWLEDEYQRKANNEQSDLSVLYIGNEEKRMQDFESFLKLHFRRVGIAAPENLSFEKLNTWDVLIVDAAVSNFPKAITKAMILTGRHAAQTAAYFGSKIDEFSLSLSNEAVNTDFSHAVFSAPFMVKPKLSGRNSWLVQNGENLPGLVATSWHFENVDDAEIISGEKNEKGNKGVAIARDANRLLWGFTATPANMTEDAKNTFVNAIYWIHKYDGYQQSTFAGLAERTEIIPILENRAIESKGLRRWFSEDILNETNFDREKIQSVFEENMPYVYIPYGTGQWAIDTDAAGFGTPNNDVKSIEKWIDLLKGSTKKKALGLLLRYTNHRVRGAADWKIWYTENKNKLHFSDEKGYRFIHKQ